MSDRHHRHHRHDHDDGGREERTEYDGGTGHDGTGQDGTGHDDGDAGRDAHGPERSPDLDLHGMGEHELRRLLQDSVRDIEPSDDALDHLRQAVPARRARRRNVLVGAAAAVLACGVAVPAMLHADIGPGGSKPMFNAGHSQSHDPDGKLSTSGDAGDGVRGRDHADQGTSGEADRGAETGAPTTGSSSVPNPSTSLGPVSPTCTREQLGEAGATHGQPDAEGHIYGRFRVVNTSEDSCTVDGDGIVLATAQGSADSTRIQVVDHTTGDEATGLPDPVNAADEVVLEPGGAYVVRFAWIPREGGGAGGCPTSSPEPGTGGGEGGDGTQESGGAQPMGTAGSQADAADSGGSTGTTSGAGAGEGGDGTPSPGGASGGTEGSGSGGSSSGGSEGGGTTGGGGGGDPDPASVLLAHTPEVGEPTAGTVALQGACAGTVFRTGVLPAA